MSKENEDFYEEIKNGDFKKVVRYIQESPKIVNARHNSVYPLHVAAYYNNAQMITLLLEKGANINKPSFKDGKTALHYAIMKNNESATIELLKNNANVNCLDDDETSPLTYAVFAGFINIVNVLIEYGADLKLKNSDGYTAIHIACTQNRQEIVKLLLEKGIDVNIRDANDVTPLHYAATGGAREMFVLLLTLNYRKFPEHNYRKRVMLIILCKPLIQLIRFKPQNSYMFYLQYI